MTIIELNKQRTIEEGTMIRRKKWAAGLHLRYAMRAGYSKVVPFVYRYSEKEYVTSYMFKEEELEATDWEFIG